MLQCNIYCALLYRLCLVFCCTYLGRRSTIQGRNKNQQNPMHAYSEAILTKFILGVSMYQISTYDFKARNIQLYNFDIHKTCMCLAYIAYITPFESGIQASLNICSVPKEPEETDGFLRHLFSKYHMCRP